jgi:hypothetical protein
LKEKSTKGLVMSLLSVWSIPKAKLLSWQEISPIQLTLAC